MSSSLVARSLSRMRAIVTQATQKPSEPSQKELLRIQKQLEECAEGLGGEVSARQRAAQLANTYLRLGEEGKRAMLKTIALDFGPKPQAISKAHTEYQEAVGSSKQWEAEAQLRMVMRSKRMRILTQFNAIPQGVKFLVDLRADLLRFAAEEPLLKPLDRELEAQLAAWFDVGFLELQRISWESPAALLERLVKYEAVHAIRSWEDLKNRLDSDRRCYAFFHPRMPLEPLIFVQVALTNSLADNVQRLLDIRAPLGDAAKADTAIFYSITSSQAGLRGVSFGNFLLKRVIDNLQRDFPRLRTFATLSPIPGLVRWVKQNPQNLSQTFTASDWKKLAPEGVPQEMSQLIAFLTDNTEWTKREALASALQMPLLRLAASYLLEARHGERPADSVARFHLGNGAQLERLNWLADTSEKGFAQSWGMMVNYLYETEMVETNIEAYARNGKISTSSTLRKQAKV